MRQGPWQIIDIRAVRVEPLHLEFFCSPVSGLLCSRVSYGCTLWHVAEMQQGPATKHRHLTRSPPPVRHPDELSNPSLTFLAQGKVDGSDDWLTVLLTNRAMFDALPHVPLLDDTIVIFFNFFLCSLANNQLLQLLDMSPWRGRQEPSRTFYSHTDRSRESMR